MKNKNQFLEALNTQEFQVARTLLTEGEHVVVINKVDLNLNSAQSFIGATETKDKYQTPQIGIDVGCETGEYLLRLPLTGYARYDELSEADQDKYESDDKGYAVDKDGVRLTDSEKAEKSMRSVYRFARACKFDPKGKESIVDFLSNLKGTEVTIELKANEGGFLDLYKSTQVETEAEAEEKF